MTNSRKETIGVPLAEYLKEKCWNSPKRPMTLIMELN